MKRPRNVLATPARKILATLCLALASVASGTPAQGSDMPHIGEVMLVGFNFCPVGWTEADGQVLAINQNTALFSLIGTTYGGNGVTTFALPDLRGRAPVHVGQGPGLSNIPWGQAGGAESVTLGVNQLPAHGHTATSTLHASGDTGESDSPSGKVLAQAAPGDVYASQAADVAMGASSVSTTVTSAGGGEAVAIRPPYLGMRYCIALQGSFPSRP